MTAIASALRHPAADIRVVTLDDAVVVRLRGTLDHGCLARLSDVLLQPRPAGRRTIVVEAGYVDAVAPAALAVLLTASDWAASNGGCLIFATLSWSLLDLVRRYGLDGDLPRLPGQDSLVRIGGLAGGLPTL